MTNTPADHDERLRRPARRSSIWLGDTKVSFVPDGAVQGRPRAWFPDTTDDFWASHPQYLDASGHVVASLGGLLVEHGERALLIDTGFGPHAVPADPATPNGAMHGGALVDNLAELGRTPDDIDAIAFTHLHPDHLGWALQPAFGNADYLVAEPEWAEYPHDDTRRVLAPQVRTVADGHEALPGVRMRFAPGHTPGHAEFVITGGGIRLIAFGDSLHSPIQVGHPEWSNVYDHDPVEAAAHRRRLLAELDEPSTIGFGIHFADVVFGRVRRDGRGAAWQPLDAGEEAE